MPVSEKTKYYKVGLSEFCAKKNENAARVTCKFCAQFSLILRKLLRTLSSRFIHFKIISGIVVRPCFSH